jgi:hypothetical protein
MTIRLLGAVTLYEANTGRQNVALIRDAQFEAQLQGGGIVSLPAGEFLLSSDAVPARPPDASRPSIELLSTVYLQGAGMGATVLACPYDSAPYQAGAHAIDQTYFGLSDLTLDAQNTVQSSEADQHGIWLIGCSDFEIARVEVIGWYGNPITACNSTDPDQKAIRRFRIHGCKVSLSQHVGVQVYNEWGAYDFEIDHNDFFDNLGSIALAPGARSGAECIALNTASGIGAVRASIHHNTVTNYGTCLQFSTNTGPIWAHHNSYENMPAPVVGGSQLARIDGANSDLTISDNFADCRDTGPTVSGSGPGIYLGVAAQTRLVIERNTFIMPSDTWTLGLGAATAGTFTITFTWAGGNIYTTAPIAWNATAAAVAAAIQAVDASTMPDNAVTGTGGPLPANITLTFNSRYGPTSSRSINGAGLTGGTPVITQTRAGQSVFDPVINATTNPEARVRDNYGAPTAASGEVTVTTGAGQYVRHGLSITNDIANLRVRAYAATDPAVRVVAFQITLISFIIKVTDLAGTPVNNVVVRWEASYA